MGRGAEARGAGTRDSHAWLSWDPGAFRTWGRCGGRGRVYFALALRRAALLAGYFLKLSLSIQGRAGPAALGDREVWHLRGVRVLAAGRSQGPGPVSPGALSSADSAGSESGPRSASSSDSTLNGRGLDPVPSPPRALSPAGFMANEAGAMRGAAGAAGPAGCAGHRRRTQNFYPRFAVLRPTACYKKVARLSCAALQ